MHVTALQGFVFTPEGIQACALTTVLSNAALIIASLYIISLVIVYASIIIICFFSFPCTCTHMAVVVQQVVGEFEFIEGDDLLHPLGAFGRRVRVVVHPARRGGVSFTGHQPRRAVEGIPEGKASPLDSRFRLSDCIYFNNSRL